MPLERAQPMRPNSVPRPFPLSDELRAELIMYNNTAMRVAYYYNRTHKVITCIHSAVIFNSQIDNWLVMVLTPSVARKIIKIIVDKRIFSQ